MLLHRTSVTLLISLLNYPDDSAGSIMTTEYVDLSPEWTVAKAMNHIKETGIHKETIYTCYVTWQRKLIGIVSAKDLMTSDDNTLIKDIMELNLSLFQLTLTRKKLLDFLENMTFLHFLLLTQTTDLLA